MEGVLLGEAERMEGCYQGRLRRWHGTQQLELGPSN